MKEISQRLQTIMKEPMAGQQLKGEVQAIEKALGDLETYFHKIISAGAGGLEDLQTSARYFAFSLGNIFAATLMTEFALHTKDLRDIESARRLLLIFVSFQRQFDQPVDQFGIAQPAGGP